MAEIHSRKINEKEIDSIFDKDISFSGDFYFTNKVMIKGKFTGSIEGTGELYIDEKARVEAEIKANEVYIKGFVRGDISAETRVELQGKAEVRGDITAPKIVMDTGCRFDGISRMKKVES